VRIVLKACGEVSLERWQSSQKRSFFSFSFSKEYSRAITEVKLKHKRKIVVKNVEMTNQFETFANEPS